MGLKSGDFGLFLRLKGRKLKKNVKESLGRGVSRYVGLPETGIFLFGLSCSKSAHIFYTNAVYLEKSQCLRISPVQVWPG